MRTIDAKIRKLARNNYWQNLYHASKTTSSVQLFDNTTRMSNLQVKFLYWLSTYDMLFSELVKHEDDYLTLNVISDDIRTDAYLIYRNKKNDYLWKQHREEEKKAEIRHRHPKKHKNGNMDLIDVDLRRE